MAVGASFGARLEHLRARKGTKETDLAKVFGINRSTIGRILKGETEKVSSQLVIDTAQYFGVSTDFLLGLTDMPDPMNHPMEEFKLTEGAAKAILYEDVHVEMLNRLLENPRFCQLTHTMAYALEPEQTVGALSFDNILAHGESLFLEVMTPSQKIKREMKKDSQKIASQIVDPNTVGNGKMLEEFRAIIQQIRKDMKMEKPLSVPVTREFLKEMDKEILSRADGERKNINPRIVAEVIVDKSMVANICTPAQREKFIDLMEDILITYRGEDGGEGT
ncbi:MAG: helix-turn-helix domain-containing protein [Bacteroidaceae bacterium]|jgi:transcriptional regulator with XRE-family HTH domain|nr:helix-turn-helix domain-containing protein [Bacteroidaceae bacterium]